MRALVCLMFLAGCAPFGGEGDFFVYDEDEPFFPREGEGEGESDSDNACEVRIVSVRGVAVAPGVVPFIAVGDDVRLRVVSTSAVDIAVASWFVAARPPGSALALAEPSSLETGVVADNVQAVDVAGTYVVEAEATKPNAPTSHCAAQFTARVFPIVRATVDASVVGVGVRPVRAGTTTLVPDAGGAGSTDASWFLRVDTDVVVEYPNGATPATATLRVFVDGALAAEMFVALDQGEAPAIVRVRTAGPCVEDLTDGDTVDECP